ncbi:MAG TPA: TetR/AcrR family transcriptional regulator [Pedomonas sp.]|uniref:TetR/AcrR family transcriptional regulator n=1 Tax=Pedomonas sp. TaxID=2976421 RepID=UPI002F3E3254
MNDAPQQAGSAPQSRGRPRSAETDAKILSAARKLLAEGGFDAMSFEAIAKMTGITRATIYRRWPSKFHLVNEVAHRDGSVLPDIIDEQGLRAQIREYVQVLLNQYTRPEMKGAFAGLVSTYQQFPELRDEIKNPLEREGRDYLKNVIEKGKRQGIVTASTDIDALFDLLVGAVIYRTMFSVVDTKENFKESLCDILLQGIEVKPAKAKR